jgi:SAM-dependent methyltransferase
MPEKMILDYGCGLGGNFPMLSKKGNYVGLDILPENIDYAQKRYGQRYFQQFAGDAVPFANNYFDEIHSYDVLEHVEDFELSLRELDRVLKPGGKIYITVPAAVSEKALQKIKPNYFTEVGHKRIADVEFLAEWLRGREHVIVKKAKVRGMEAVILSLVFWLKGKKQVVGFQTGSPQFNIFLVAFIWLFDSRLFRTKLKYLFFIYIFTLPIGWLISRVFPKSIYMVAQKKV